MSQYNVLKVKIYGTEYPIRGDSDIEYIKRIAEYVDAKMREVDQSLSEVSALKVAILAALNIADELFKERNKNETLVHYDFEEKIDKWLVLLNKELESQNENQRNNLI
ncbi:cell division protein ZapA [candidate division KSB1 bacterium]|nr:cell division protein ZapA [candidate division KSB1 bacterium]